MVNEMGIYENFNNTKIDTYLKRPSEVPGNFDPDNLAKLRIDTSYSPNKNNVEEALKILGYEETAENIASHLDAVALGITDAPIEDRYKAKADAKKVREGLGYEKVGLPSMLEYNTAGFFERLDKLLEGYNRN